MPPTNSSNRPKSTHKTIAIFGSCSTPAQSEPYRLAGEIGTRLANAGFEVLNGGYGGTMTAASKAAKDAGGTTIGVTCPSLFDYSSSRIQPNPYLDIVLPAPDILSRIQTMMRLSGGFVVLDGGTGTLSELAVVWESVGKRFVPPRPIVVVGHYWNQLVDVMRQHRASSVQYLHRAETAEQVVEILNEHAVSGTRARHQKKTPSHTDATATVSQLRGLVEKFVAERKWQPFHNPKNISASIAIEAAELMEHFQWLRSDQLDQIRNDPSRMEPIREEIADILAYVLSFAETMDIDLAAALADKMKKNAVKYPVDQYRGKFE